MNRLYELESFLKQMVLYAEMCEARVWIQGESRCIVSDIQHWDEDMSAYVRARFRGCKVVVQHSSGSLSGFQVVITPAPRSMSVSNEFVVFVMMVGALSLIAFALSSLDSARV